MTYGKAMSILHRAKKIRFDETGTQSDTEYHRHVPLIFILQGRGDNMLVRHEHYFVELDIGYLI